MKPEQLKIIAIGMGYETAHTHKGRLFYDGSFDMPIEYEPDTTNNDQMVEIVDMLLDIGCAIGKEENSNNVVVYLGGEFLGEGKTINEAVCNAAYEYFKAMSIGG